MKISIFYLFKNLIIITRLKSGSSKKLITNKILTSCDTWTE